MKVAVLAGGRSSEHDVSLSSAESVREGLVEGGHEPLDVRIDRDGRWTHDGKTVALEPSGGLLGADVAFPVLHGPFGEDGTVQGLLELLDIPYVGAGVMASAVAMDKSLFKDLMAAHGMPQVDHVVIREGGRGRLAPPAVRQARAARFVGRASQGVVRGGARRTRCGGRSSTTRSCSWSASWTGWRWSAPCSVTASRARRARARSSSRRRGWYDYEAKYEPGGMELIVPARLPEPVLEHGAPAGGGGVQDRRLLGHGAGGLLRRGRPGARERAEHDPRLHRHERVREAPRGRRHPVLRAARPAARRSRRSATRRTAAYRRLSRQVLLLVRVSARAPGSAALSASGSFVIQTR